VSSGRLTIALVSELSGPPDEGMRVWVAHYAAAMRAAGHTVTELRCRGPERIAAADPRVLVRLRRLRPDVVQYVPYSGLTTAALLRLRLLGTAAPAALRCIAVLQAGRDGFGAPPGLAADVALFASERLRRATGRVARSGAVAYPVVDTARFASSGGDRAETRRELGVPAEAPMALHVGHLKRSRNLEALGALARGGEVFVVLVGSTSTDADPALRRELEQAGVRIVRRFVPDIERIYAAADVYVFPVQDRLGSIELPLSVVEALASRLPVVTTRFGALPELFAGEAAVTFCAPEDVEQTVAGVLSRGVRPPRPDLSAVSPQRFAASVERALRRLPRAELVVLAGVDGAGKSTQVELLREQLEGSGFAVSTLWCRWDPLLVKPAVALLGLLSRLGRGSPGARAVGDRRRSIRGRVLANPLAWRAWRALMVVDYGMRIAPVVRRARRTSDVVLLDRYWHDVMVDFSFGGPLHEPPAMLRRLLPDARGLVFLDVEERVALARKPDGPDLRYLSERRRLYGEAAQRYGGKVIDAGREPDAVFRSLSAAVEGILDGRGAPAGTQGERSWAAAR
jgi:thymidylate kinase/glycosyltransferase involved in cell wall biosynthesis